MQSVHSSCGLGTISFISRLHRAACVQGTKVLLRGPRVPKPWKWMFPSGGNHTVCSYFIFLQVHVTLTHKIMTKTKQWEASTPRCVEAKNACDTGWPASYDVLQDCSVFFPTIFRRLSGSFYKNIYTAPKPAVPSLSSSHSFRKHRWPAPSSFTGRRWWITNWPPRPPSQSPQLTSR